LISGKIGLIKIIKCLYQKPCRANCAIINAIAYFRRDYLLSGKTYERIIESKFRWVTWAAPKLKNGNVDQNPALALLGQGLKKSPSGQKLNSYCTKMQAVAVN
jgi:hypothetical protein